MRATPYLPPTPGADEDWSADDPALRRVLARRLPAAAWKELEPRLAALGRAAPADIDPLAREADAHPPRLREDGTLAFHPSYARLQALARRHEAFTLAWRPLGGMPRAGRLAGLALGYLFAQAECGYYCPACMTDAAALVLERHAPPDLAARLVPRLVQASPEGALEGAMFLTEREGGSDVGGATRTAAERAPEGGWRLTGDKWFASNAGAGCILTLARMPGAPEGTRGLGLFVVPAALDDGRPNPGLRLVALKEKLGVRSMATAEVELRGAHAWLVAPAPGGFKAMAEMVNLSRLHNAIASVAIARRALREGQRNGVHRRAFGKPLAAHPLYRQAVAALAVETRGALLFTLDAAEAFDRGRGPLLRALTPMAKAMTARLAVRAASEACEFLGGNGYVETWVTPRLLRDAQVLPIWEGTTNVQALDLLRAFVKEGALDAFLEDTRALLRDAPGAVPLLAGLDALEQEARRRPREGAALRWLARGYHLRAAALLRDDARDADPAARAFAEAYATLCVLRDEPAFEELVAAKGDALCGWPTSSPAP